MAGTFYYLCSVLDGASRAIVHWEIREAMTEADVECIIERARERFPDARPRIISDNGPQFIAREDRGLATRSVSRLRREVLDVRRQPDANRPAPNFMRDDLRELAVASYRIIYQVRTKDLLVLAGIRMWSIRGFKNHLIFYRPSPEGLDVVRVLHGARDIPRILGEDQ
ncbi:DDE-type integrase/transposase/recombinase [Planctomycetota bacterium]